MTTMTKNSCLETPRAADGRYKKHPPCECCGKPALDYCTDEAVCGGDQKPGFVVCERKRCHKRAVKAGGGHDWFDERAVAGRRALYERQDAENRAALAEGRNPRTVAL